MPFLCVSCGIWYVQSCCNGSYFNSLRASSLEGGGAIEGKMERAFPLLRPHPRESLLAGYCFKTFPNIARLPHSLYITSCSCQIPIKKCPASGVGQVFIRQIDSNLGVLQGALLLMLCNSLKQRNFIPLSCQIDFIQPYFCLCCTYNHCPHELGNHVQNLFKAHCKV